MLFESTACLRNFHKLSAERKRRLIRLASQMLKVRPQPLARPEPGAWRLLQKTRAARVILLLR